MPKWENLGWSQGTWEMDENLSVLTFPNKASTFFTTSDLQVGKFSNVEMKTWL